MRIKNVEDLEDSRHPADVPPVHSELTFQPILLGTEVFFEGEECSGMITDENEIEVFIESDFFTGWTSKALFWELGGAE